MANITPVEITPGSASAWTDADLSALIASGSTGIRFHVENVSAGALAFGFRKNGSADNRVQNIGPGAHFWGAIGVDGSRIADFYVGSTTDINIWLIGDYGSEAFFFDDAVNKSTATTSSWVDVDIAGDTGAATAIGAVFEYVSTTSAFGLRKNGSADNRVASPGTHNSAIIGIDSTSVPGAELCEQQITSSNGDLFLVGYIKSDAIFNLDATDRSLGGTGSWTALTALPSGAITGVYESIGSTTDVREAGLRKNGSAEAIIRMIWHSWPVIECDGSRLVEMYIESVNVDAFEVGYFTAVAGGSTVTKTTSLTAAIRAARTVAASLSAAVRSTRTVTTSLSTAVRVTNAAATAVQAAVQATQTKTAALQTAVQATQTKATTLSTAVQTTGAKTATLDSTIAVTGSKTATIDTAVQAMQAKTAVVDAAVLATQTQTASLDTAIQASLLASTAITAAVQATQAASATLDAYVQAGSQLNSNLDAAIQYARLATASLDTAIGWTQAATSSADAAIEETHTAAASLEAAVQVAQSATAVLSAAIQDSLSVACQIDAAIQLTNSKALSFDGAVSTGRTITAILDAYVEIGGTNISAFMDAVIALNRTITAVFDAYITIPAPSVGFEVPARKTMSVGARDGFEVQQRQSMSVGARDGFVVPVRGTNTVH